MAQRETRNKRQKKKARFGLSSWQRIWLPPTSGWTRIWINGWSGIHSHRGRDRANAHGVDDERIGKCDLWASARGSGNPTAPTSLPASGLGVGGDRRGAVGTSGDESKADATARRNAAVHLGEPRAGKAGKREIGRIGGGALEPGATPRTQPKRRIQSAQSHAGECARL